MNHLPNMKTAFFLALMLVGFSTVAQAQAILSASASHDVTCEVLEINSIGLTDATVSIVIDANNVANAGEGTISETASTSYSISTNGTNKKIIGALDVAASTGTLEVQLTPPSTGVSQGKIALSTTPVNLVTGVSRVAGAALGMEYTFTVDVTDGVMAADTKTVTYTILDS